MSRGRSLILFLLLGLLITSCGSGSGSGCQAALLSSSDRLLGNPAPNFTLPRLGSESVVLAEIVKEKPTLLVFWATWCPSCVEEVPLLNQWMEKYPDLQILAVNVEEPRERVAEFVEKHKIRYPVLLDETGEVASQYGLVGIPAAVLMARGGRVIYYGFVLPKNIEKLIEE